MPTIIPLRELKNPSQVSAMCHELGQPVFVTKNGKSDLVILTSEAYDSLTTGTPLSGERYEEHDTAADGSPRAAETISAYISARDSKDVYSIAELKKILTPIFADHRVERATLFGSYVKGTADTRSDVDILVDTELRGLAFYGLLDEVANTLRFPVDLIARRQLEKGSPMEQEIKDTGVIIYEREG